MSVTSPSLAMAASRRPASFRFEIVTGRFHASSSAATTSIAIIVAEHRQLSSSLQLLATILENTAPDSQRMDFPLIAAILHYIEVYPERLHHPKEERYLFTALRRAALRVGDKVCVQLLETFSNEHLTSMQLLDRFQSSFIAVQAGTPGAMIEFLAASSAYREFHLEHMIAEERHLLPRAVEYLGRDDWTTIANALSAHRNPIDGLPAQSSCDRLRDKIVVLLRPSQRLMLREAEHAIDMTFQ